ncbi:MAG: endopeptidase La, partial [Myxococcota bacterium]
MYPQERDNPDREHEAVFRQVKLNLQEFFQAHPQTLQEVMVNALSIEDWGELADFVAQHLSRDVEERLRFLQELDINTRLRLALEVTLRELDLLTVGNRISDEIRTKVETHQREFLLREQLKAIRRELGEEKDQVALALEELQQKLDDAQLPEHARKRADDELGRLQMLSAESPEHNVVRSYLDWIGSLPWSKLSEETEDLSHARSVLDDDHYGLEEVKERILEFLAVRQLKPDASGSILLLAGPPGVGKTSLGKSIARGLGREFYRFSVGGMRDESEIKGHRRTYIGALPGRILQGLKQTGARNPVFMIDEIDKMGSDWRGDPSSAMLEVLDPAQNRSFLDHYLDLTFDLSRVMFIATANVKSEIPGPLLDRMEVIDLPGYIPEEKVEIGMRYLVPRQRSAHGLQASHLKISKSAVRRAVTEYTHEAGVRDLERQIGKIARKRAKKLVEGERASVSITGQNLPEWLGPPRVQEERVGRRPKAGVAVGLAWTQVGGDILFIEAATM